MTIKLQKPDIRELKPKITVFGVGGGGGNAVNNMIAGGLQGVEFVVANTDAQALTMSRAERIIQLGVDVTQGLGAGSQPDVGRASAEECIDEIADHLQGTHMAFITAGMGGGTGTGAAPVVARAARELGILTVGVVTKPFHFEGGRRMKTAETGIEELQKNVDTLIVIPNQNLFRIANDKTTFADAFGMADQVLYSGVACITDLMVKEGLINLDFADVRSVMREMGKAMMGTGEASGDGRAMQAAEAAISNPLLDETSMRGARGLLISITGGRDLTLFEVDEAATRIREEVDSEANIILGATFDEALEGVIRVSVVATGIDRAAQEAAGAPERPAAATISRVQPARPPAAQAPVQPAVAAAQPSQPPRATPVATEQRIARAAEALARPNPAARVERDGVSIEPMKPRVSLLSDSAIEEEFRNELEKELMPSSERFIPEAPLVPEPQPAARMPEVADFPPMIRAEIERQASPPPEAQEERGPIGLLKKLAHGFGGREPEPAPPQRREPAPAAAERQVQRPPAQTPRPAGHAPHGSIGQGHAPRPGQPPQARAPVPPAQPAGRAEARGEDSPFAPRRAALDANGRITPVARHGDDDDQLDIPAFLRRQSS
ncbi:MAG: cell division protein FtsZ [Alphaproteobacteria bacterium]|nr:MAG: cell division protein FtsZ [Alphaproteobacteria bacterium]